MWPDFLNLWHKSTPFRICIATVAVGIATLYFQGSAATGPAATDPSSANTAATAAAPADPQAAPTTPATGTADPNAAVDPLQTGADIANDVLNTFDRSLRRTKQ